MAERWAWLAVDLDVGVWTTWPAGPRPRADAVLVAAEVLDPEGVPAVVALQLFPPGAAPLYDDVAVQHVLRRWATRTRPAPRAVSSLTRDAVHWAGCLTVWPADADPAVVARDDPARLLGPVGSHHVPAGVLGTAPPVTGPGTQRYAGLPLPAAGFPGAGGPVRPPA